MPHNVDSVYATYQVSCRFCASENVVKKGIATLKRVFE